MNYPNTFTFWCGAEGLALAACWARQGLSNAEIALRAGVRTATFLRWRQKSPALNAAVLQGRDWANAAVEGALLKRALGYTVTEVAEEDGPSGLKTKSGEKHIPGDLSAQMYWLKTRCPELWGEKSAAPRNGVVQEIIEAVKNLE